MTRESLALISAELAESTFPWFLGFSGGKDSTAALKLVYLAQLTLPLERRRPLTVVYCDTGVDIPVVAAQVRRTLRALTQEARSDGVPLSVRVVSPKLSDRYFVKVIGRGYPPPSNKFRWCTDRLRIDPVARVLKTRSEGPNIIVLGLRHGESGERDRTIRRHHTAGTHYLRQSGNPGIIIFSPILNYRTEDVWSTLNFGGRPLSIDVPALTRLYKDAAGECPSIRDPRGSPCGKGRFGCWTCTVVRTDRAVSSMVQEGHAALAPLLGWRNWLMTIRDNPEHRCPCRRNGQPGPGPFTLRARRLMLSRLRRAETASGYRLIREEEIEAIHDLWREDRNSAVYFEQT